MTNKEVARTFAREQGRRDCRSLHMFIEDGTVYSYGHHFPIARFINEYTVAFTTRGYSLTTARHKRLVYNELQETDVVIVPLT